MKILSMPASAGSSLNKNIGLLTLTQPSDTNTANTTKRTWTKSSKVTGIESQNYYYPSATTVTSVSDDTISVRNPSNINYGFGYVLPDDVTGGSNLHLEFTRNITSCMVWLASYQSDGTFIGSSMLLTASDPETTKSTNVAIPANAEYILLGFAPTVVNTDVTLTLNAISI